MNKNVEGGFLISKIKQIQDRALEKKLREQKRDFDNLNQSQGRILCILWKTNGISITEIKEQTALSYSALTSLIDRLEHSEHIVRKPDGEDRRKTLIFLTDKSLKLKTRYEKLVRDTFMASYKDFSDDEIFQCENYLNRIYKNIQN